MTSRRSAKAFALRQGLTFALHAVLLLAFAGSAGAQDAFRFAGAPCATPPVLHCPDKDCPSDRVINEGPVVEMKTRRTYFLDYPCDIKPGEKVTFVLALHGGGSYGNWQRNYFPLMDFKDKYRLVVATPNSPTRVWSDADDEYLHNLVESVVSQLGKENVKAFWLAGHSQGGMTSNRIIRTDFFKDKVDGWISLSGGRLGANPGRGNFAGMAGPPGAATAGRGAAPGAGRGAGPASRHRRAGCQPTTSPSSTKRVSVRWTRKGCRSRRRGRSVSAAARGGRRSRSPTPRPDMSTTAAVRIRRCRPGVCCRVRARRVCSCIRTAGTAAWSPTSCAWTKDTPRGSSPPSPKSS